MKQAEEVGAGDDTSIFFALFIYFSFLCYVNCFVVINFFSLLFYLFTFFMKITFIFSCSGMFCVLGFIDAQLNCFYQFDYKQYCTPIRLKQDPTF